MAVFTLMEISATMKVATCVLRTNYRDAPTPPHCVNNQRNGRKERGASARPPAPKNTFINLDSLSCNQTTNSRLLSLTKL